MSIWVTWKSDQMTFKSPFQLEFVYDSMIPTMLIAVERNKIRGMDRS